MFELVITILFGWLGVHKFIKKKFGLGLLYFFTLGLFGIGWAVDIVICAYKLAKKSATPQIDYSITSFDVAGINYRTEEIKTIMKKSNRNYSDFVYRVKEDFVVLIPEPQNEHDKNAIAIYMNNVKIGYVPTNITNQVRELMNTCKFVGTITGGDKFGTDNIIERNFNGTIKVIK